MLKTYYKGTAIAAALIVWALVILTIALAAFIFKPWQNKTQDTISVSATGKSQIAPNIAKLSATVSTSNDDLDLARKQNEEKVTSLINALKDLGVDQKDIQTQYISGGETYEIQSEPSRPDNLPDGSQIQIYPPPTGKQTNQISTTFEVTIRDFTIADEVVAAFTKNGAANIYGPQLTVDDQTLERAKSQARKDAVANARNKASDLAGELGKKVGDATSVVEQGDFGVPIPLIAISETELQQKASQIQPGENEVTVTIQVEFELK